jgi:hypothetical protein
MSGMSANLCPFMSFFFFNFWKEPKTAGGCQATAHFFNGFLGQEVANS